MSDPYSIYNAITDIMCVHCNKTIRKKCNDRDEDTRCKTKILCMNQILKIDYEEYPIKLPNVKS